MDCERHGDSIHVKWATGRAGTIDGEAGYAHEPHIECCSVVDRHSCSPRRIDRAGGQGRAAAGLRSARVSRTRVPAGHVRLYDPAADPLGHAGLELPGELIRYFVPWKSEVR